MEPASGDLEPASGNLDPASGDLDPASGDLEPASDDLEPSSGDLEPSSGNLEPSSGDLKPSSGDLEPSSVGLPRERLEMAQKTVYMNSVRVSFAGKTDRQKTDAWHPFLSGVTGGLGVHLRLLGITHGLTCITELGMQGLGAGGGDLCVRCAAGHLIGGVLGQVDG